MPSTETTLIPARYAQISVSAQYTVAPPGTASSRKVVIDAFTVTNTSTANAALSVWIVESSESAGDNNLVIDARTVFPGDTISLVDLYGHTLAEGASITTQASDASALVIRASGRVVTID